MYPPTGSAGFVAGAVFVAVTAFVAGAMAGAAFVAGATGAAAELLGAAAFLSAITSRLTSRLKNHTIYFKMTVSCKF